ERETIRRAWEPKRLPLGNSSVPGAKNGKPKRARRPRSKAAWVAHACRRLACVRLRWERVGGEVAFTPPVNDKEMRCVRQLKSKFAKRTWNVLWNQRKLKTEWERRRSKPEFRVHTRA